MDRTGKSGQPQDKTPQNSKPRLLHQLWTRSCDATISHILILCTLAITSHLLAKSTAAMRLRVQMLSMVSFLSVQLLVSTISGSPCVHLHSFHPQSSPASCCPAAHGLGELKHRLFQRFGGCPANRTLPKATGWGVLGDWKN